MFETHMASTCFIGVIHANKSPAGALQSAAQITFHILSTNERYSTGPKSCSLCTIDAEILAIT